MIRNKFCKNRRGISPAITSIILIGVAVAAGIGSYSTYASTANTASLKGSLMVEGASLIKQSNGEEWLSVTIKNSGNKAFSTTLVSLQIDTDPAAPGIQPFVANPVPAALSPGQTASASARIVSSAGVPITDQNIGDTLPVEVTATTTDGSTVREIRSVTINQ